MRGPRSFWCPSPSAVRPTTLHDEEPHKFTTDVAKRHGWVGIENLRVVAMTASAAGNVEVPGRNVHQKATLNRAILDNAPGERRRQLAYKTRRFGSELRLVAPAGTSQTCAACGHRDPASRPGCGPVFSCTECGYQAHADANAARNIEALAAGQAGPHAQSPSGGEALQPDA
jgi:putative transposase